MDQNTSEWLSWRNKGIGASDAPIIMGESKYATPHELFLEKTGQAPPKPVNEFVTQLGHRFEPRARAYFNLLNDCDYVPALAVHSEYEWLRASLDGLEKDSICEIKYIGVKKLDDLRRGAIDRAHHIQVQHQLMVTGMERCLYLAYTLADRKAIDQIEWQWINYDKDFVDNELWPKLAKFWDMVQKKEWRL